MYSSSDVSSRRTSAANKLGPHHAFPHREALSIARQLLLRAEASPDSLAYASADPVKNVALSYAALCERASGIAARLAQVTEAGDRVMLVYQEPLDFLPAFFGCCLAGVIPVPVAPRHSRDTMLAIAEDCGAVIALTAEARDALPGLRWMRTDETEGAAPFLRAAGEGSPVLLQYTSGSTRTPQGVVVTQTGLWATIEDLDRGAMHDADSVMISWLPYFHDMGLVYGILTPLQCGFPAYLMAPEKFVAQPMSWLRAIEARRGTHTAAPNFAYALCADRAADLAPGTDLSSLRYALNGAEPVRCDTVRRFEAAFAPFGLKPSVVAPGYGLAEATLKVTAGRCGEGTRGVRFGRDALARGRVSPEADGVELAACGSSLIDTRVRIVDPDTREPCAADVVGEIWVSGSTVADSYWRRPEESREIFGARLADDDGVWLRTGDLGFLYDGDLFVTSRLKDLIIVGGRNFYSHDLEDTVSACHPSIRMGRVFAAAVDGEEGEGVLIGAEVRGGCEEADAREILPVIRAALAREHGVAPARVALLRRGSILRTSSGKTRRSATRDALLRGELSIIADDAADMSDDAILAEISSFVPGAAATPDARLIDLGLDSLSAARLAAMARARHGVELSFATLFALSAEQLRREIVAARARHDGSAAPVSVRGYAAGEPFELSEMQQAYWIGQQGGVPLGRVSPHIRVDFEIDAARAPELGRRLASLVARHPSLRMTVGADGRGVFDALAYDPLLPPQDLRGLDAAEAAERLEATRASLAERDGPPVVAAVTRLTDSTAILHMRLGLLAGDLRSFLQLMAELASGAAGDVPAQLITPMTPATPTGEQREAWLRRVEAIAPAPELPMKMALADVAEPRFAGCRRELPAALSAALAARAQGLGVTLTSLCIAAFADTLRLWTAAHAFTLNVTCNTRAEQAGQAIGDYTSNALLSLSERHESFAAFAREVQRQVWADLDAPWCSGVSILRELSRRNGAPVLMPVVLTSLLSGDPADDLSILDDIGRVVDMANPTPQVSLHAVLGRRGDRLLVMWEFVAQLFPEGMIDAMFDAFLGALETMATEAAALERPTVARLAPEQAARREAVNATEAERAPRRLETPIIRQARTAPEAVAVRQGAATLSYGELLRQAEDIAGALRQSGVARGDVVAAIVAPGPRAVAALLGIVMAGAVYLPIEPSWPAARIEELLGEAGARHAVVSEGGWTLPVQALRLDLPLPRGDAGPAPDLEAGDAAYVIFTSGSTGRPKGVLIAHEAAANTIDDINERFAVGPADRTLCVSSLAFDLSVYDIFGLLAVGGEVVFPKRARDPDAMAQALCDGRITIWNSVPAVLELLLDVAAPRSPDLRLALLSGDWIAPGLAGRLRDAFPALRPISLGGATEVSIWSVVHPIAPEDAALASIPYGRPLSNQQCFVRAPDGRERPDGVVGELLLGGRGLALAYLGNEAETQRRFFIDAEGRRLYRTGDLARWQPDGELELLGRMDGQVKVQGYRIELGEIEAAAMRAGSLARAVASVVRRNNATAIQLHVVARPDYDGDIVAAVRAKLVLHLPAYMQPHHVTVLDALPLTANGKVDRARLAALAAPAPASAKPAAAARRDDSLEATMLAAFAEVVGVEIDPQQGFFDAGATSMHVVRLRALLASRGVAVPPLVDFFSLATIRALAERADSGDADLSPMIDVDGARAYRQRVRARKEAL
ncbi:amino acid adenylation domain-containing protein [Chromobacterium haemolyticum]|uniref:amino acid adenylation domain-containing protein n=1 Tax=Chromobacterium haemolyticum TaxID=394935 RepID=UPI001747D10E|nr:amino acid adenylation domain-containing protein [Chromobacterium haemolyticum]QOD81531.1 amino acid adenylation domain-containing protein [Chromobacterium haemolyticum]